MDQTFSPLYYKRLLRNELGFLQCPHFALRLVDCCYTVSVTSIFVAISSASDSNRGDITMITLDCLEQALGHKATAATSSPRQPLSDSQYCAGFDILRSSGRMIYHDFIIPQLTQLLAPLFNSRLHVSALEIGPGPESVLGHLPSHLRCKIRA